MQISDVRFYAQRRLWISRMEADLLKLAPQIPLEIILVITASNGVISLDKLYDSINATDAAIRIHLKSLRDLNFIALQPSKLDKRARSASLTPEGLKKLDILNQNILLKNRDFFKNEIDVTLID